MMRALICRARGECRLEEVEHRKPENGEVLIEVHYSSLNYKDALGVSGQGDIFKIFPVVPGIDAAGIVRESRSKNFKVGDAVVVTGCGLGETHDGGYAQFAVENENNVVPLPQGLSPQEAMVYGTAGFTAALCLERMVTNGQIREMGPIVVTGASGGVGQFAVSFFSTLGFEVIAVSGKKHAHSRLKDIGASRTVTPEEIIPEKRRPLLKARFGGAVDNVGGQTLADLLSQTQLWGNVASVGLAESAEINSTVMPHILRGVSLLGISSNNTPRALREKIWRRLASDLKPKNLPSFLTKEIHLPDVQAEAKAMLDRQTIGRYVVRLI